MDKKLRVLLVGEASFLSTGFARHGYEVLSRLHASGKYDCAEIGCFASKQDQRISQIPWKYYANAPDEKDCDAFQSCQDYMRGGWIFDDVCADFQPDCVVDLRDPWDSAHQISSPARPLFIHILAPTVDSQPLEEQWIFQYEQADAVFTYSEFGRETLEEQGGGRIKWKGHIPHAPDIDIFKPLDKQRCRKAIGFEPDDLIHTAVMRNSKRKLWNELLVAFRLYLDKCPPEMARRSKLHMHTQAVDMAWNFPKMINELGLSNHCTMTYLCLDCGRVYASPYQDPLASCLSCGSMRAVHPSVNCGISREALATILCSSDCLSNIATCEGFGTTQVEGAACGLRVFSLDYSAMRDVVRNIMGIPVKIGRMFREAETHAWRALPDNEHMAEELFKWMSLPESVRASWVPKIREATIKHYTADKTAQTLMDYLDTVQPKNLWNSPPRFVTPQKIPKTLSPTEYVKAGFTHMVGRPDLVSSFVALHMARDLERQKCSPATGPHYFNDMSMYLNFPQYRSYDYDDAENDFLMMVEAHNNFEKKRTARR